MARDLLRGARGLVVLTLFAVAALALAALVGWFIWILVTTQWPILVALIVATALLFLVAKGVAGSKGRAKPTP